MKKINNILTNIISTPVIPVALAAITSLYSLEAKSFWVDETFSYYVSHYWNFLIYSIWNTEANMSLYYVLLHFWILLGQSDYFIRLFSVIFAVLTVFVFYKLGKYMFNSKIAFISSLLLSLHTFFVLYAQEARSYTLALFLICLSVYSFLRYRENNKYKALLVISSVLSAYAHIYALFVLSSLSAFTIVKKNIKTYFFSFAAILVFLIPLLLAPSLRSNQASWIGNPTLSNIVGTFYLLSGDFLPLSVIYMLLFIYSGIVFMKDNKNLMLYMWIFVPILISLVLSFLKPIYQSSYFVVVLPAFLLLVSNAVDQIKNRVWHNLILACLIVFSIIRLGFWYSNAVNSYSVGPIHVPFVLENQGEDWKHATKYITEHGTKNDVVIFYVYFGKLDYEYYQTNNSPLPIEIASKSYNQGGGEFLPEPDVNLLNNLKNNYIWFVINRETETKFSRSSQYHNVLSALEKNYRLIEETDYSQVKVKKFIHL